LVYLSVSGFFFKEKIMKFVNRYTIGGFLLGSAGSLLLINLLAHPPLDLGRAAIIVVMTLLGLIIINGGIRRN
jgi:hypothetical protein